jgi:hypothetical protein
LSLNPTQPEQLLLARYVRLFDELQAKQEELAKALKEELAIP